MEQCLSKQRILLFLSFHSACLNDLLHLMSLDLVVLSVIAIAHFDFVFCADVIKLVTSTSVDMK